MLLSEFYDRDAFIDRCSYKCRHLVAGRGYFPATQPHFHNSERRLIIEFFIDLRCLFSSHSSMCLVHLVNRVIIAKIIIIRHIFFYCLVRSLLGLGH